MAQASTREAEVAERPGELTRLVVERLTAHDVSTGPPSPRNEQRLPISCPHGRATLTVDDHWLVTWEWRPAAGGKADPRQLADLACALLAGHATKQPRLGDAYGRAGVTLKGIVGRELAARGLTVGLELYEDPVFYDMRAAIVATIPGSILDAQVRVHDDGFLTWECDYWGDAAAIGGDPVSSGWITDQERLAADIVTRVMAALSVVAQPAPAPRPPLGVVSGRRRAWLRFLQIVSSGWQRV